MLTINPASDIRIEVTETNNVVEEPILALCDPEDVVARLLDDTKAGFTVDNADIEGIKKMILRCYSIWKNKEVLPRDWEKIRRYTRKNQCKILLDYLANEAGIYTVLD